MNPVKLNELIKSEIINVPLYILRMYKEFNLNVDEMTLLLFLYNKDDKIFDPNYFAKCLGMDLSKILEGVSKMVDKGLISIVTKTNDMGVKEEIIDLSPLFDKVTLKIIGELNENDTIDTDNIYDVIKKEFNRNLTPMECERINEWQQSNYSDELIKEAVKEASLNDVHSIRYIDKILYDWNKKGYKSKSDIKKTDKKEKVEVYKCDWLDSDEEI